MKVALTIAGSDSGGGAGIQADLKTFHRFGVFGTSAITAITAQNTRGVSAWEPVSIGLVEGQIDAVATDLHPAAVKTGMLGTSEIIRVVADALRRHELKNYVLDPVMVATSGDLLIEQDAVASIVSQLIPIADLVTPNADEAKVLTGIDIVSVDDMHDAAAAILELGARAVLIKGGHVRAGSAVEVIDLFYDGGATLFTHERIETTSTHGTGCTLSAAIAAHLALGDMMKDSVIKSIDFVHAAIASAPGLGSGSGPLNHFAGRSSETNSRTRA